MTPLKLLVDTNVWMDYFLVRQEPHREAVELVRLAFGSEDVVLYAVSLSLKDLAHLLENMFRRDVRESAGDVSPQAAAAARETAWGCVRAVVDKALVVPVGHAEVLQAFTLRTAHDDFEDDLLLGAAYRADVDYVVTGNAALAHRSPVPCVNASRAVELIRNHRAATA